MNVVDGRKNFSLSLESLKIMPGLGKFVVLRLIS